MHHLVLELLSPRSTCTFIARCSRDRGCAHAEIQLLRIRVEIPQLLQSHAEIELCTPFVVRVGRMRVNLRCLAAGVNDLPAGLHHSQAAVDLQQSRFEGEDVVPPCLKGEPQPCRTDWAAHDSSAAEKGCAVRCELESNRGPG